MNGDKRIIAMDLGSSRISAIAAEVTDDRKVKILAVEESRKPDLIHGGIVEQKSGVAFEISYLMNKMQNRLNVPHNKSVNISINGKTMKTHPLPVRRHFGSRTRITLAHMEDMENECCQILQHGNVAVYSIIPIKYELDGKIFDDPVEHKGENIKGEYQVVVGNEMIRENIKGAFDRAGVVVDDYIPLSIDALAKATLSAEDCEKGCALINFGATTTTLGIYHNGVLQHLTVAPFGSNHITRDIQELGVSATLAEELKQKSIAMQSLETKKVTVKLPNENINEPDILIEMPFLAMIIESRLDEIFLPVFSAISNFSSALDAGIVISGGGSKLNGIIEYIENRSLMDARYADHEDKLAPDTEDRFYLPEYAQLIGTVLLADNYMKENPEKYTPEKLAAKKPKIPSKATIQAEVEKLIGRIFDPNYL